MVAARDPFTVYHVSCWSTVDGSVAKPVPSVESDQLAMHGRDCGGL